MARQKTYYPLFGVLLLSWSSAGSLYAKEAATTSERLTASVESANHRAALPLFRVIPAAKESELTPAMAGPPVSELAWLRSNANSANTRYSPLSQINRDTVSGLEVAWIYHSNDGKGNIQANPVIVDGIIYAPTA